MDSYVNIYWDVVVDINEMKISFGVIIRDNMNEVLTTLSEPKIT
jgi:hypothetical protein